MCQQLTESDRAILAQLLELKVPKKEIARRLHKHRATIYRELARNSGPMGYIPEEAQQRTDVRRWVNHRVRKMHDPSIRRYVCQRLKRYWSPDQIAGRLRRECRGESMQCLSRQTIYQWIHQQPDEERRRWRGCLRFGVSRRRRGKTQASSPTQSASTVGRRSLLRGGATGIGKGTRLSGAATAAAWSRWSSGNPVSRSWRVSRIGAPKRCD